MSVAEMERRFYELKGKLDVGALGEAEFKAEIEKLRFQDVQSRWWMIGAQSGRWYMYDGTRWVPGHPPTEQPPPPSTPAPAVAPQPTPTSSAPMPPPPAAAVPTPPQAARTEVVHSGTIPIEQHAPPVAPLHRPAIAPARRAARRAPLASPIPFRGPVLIGCAAFAAVFIVVLFWIAVENVVPGRPISTAFAMLTGGSKTPAATPARPAGQATAPAAGQLAALISGGDEFVLQSQFDPAIAQYQAAANAAQTNPTPLTRWSRALAFRGQMQDALAKVRQATQRAPNDAEAQAQLARVLAWTGDVNQALTVGEKAVQLDPKSANAHAFLAEIYLLARRNADAATQAGLALQIAPQGAEAHRAQAWVLTINSQKDAALNEWRQTVALEPNLSFRHFEYGDVLRVFFNDAANAAVEYRRAIALDGAYIPTYSRLGLALLSANQPQQAIPQFQRAITLDAGNPEAYAYIAVAYGRADQCSQAIPYFEQALRMDAGNTVASKGLADCQSGKAPTAPVPLSVTGPIIPPTVAPAAVSPVKAPDVSAPATKSYPGN